MISKEEVLRRTNGGLDFYKFVIPNLSVNGSKCKNTLNPFYHDTKPSLSIFERDGQWFFKDFGNEQFSGDVFDFAALYYNLRPESDFNEILRKINDDLRLGLNGHETVGKVQTKNNIQSLIERLGKQPRNLAKAYLKSRNITKANSFYELQANDKFPPSVVFVNHDKTGFERRFIADEQELKQKSLPKTLFKGRKQGTVYLGAYRKDSQSVYICEGVINALSFYEQGLSAIATFGATNLPDENLLAKIITGKKVYLAGDGDRDGKKFNKHLIKIIKEAGIKVKQVYEVVFPDGLDANDVLRLGQNLTTLPVMPVIDVKFDGDVQFPLSAYPVELKNFILHANQALKFPVDYLAASILFVVSVAVGNRVRLKVKNGWEESALIYLILVGRPGVNKSHPLSFALTPLFNIEEELRQIYEAQMREYNEAKELSEDGVVSLPKPRLKEILISDITTEALYTVHSYNQQGLGLYRDEITAWINEFNRYRRGSDQQVWLSNWSNKPIKVNRKSSDTVFIKRPYVSVAGTIQTDILRDLGRDNMDKNGFIDRLLFVFPSDQKKPYFDDNELNNDFLAKYENIIYRLYYLDENLLSEQEYILVEMDTEAREIFKTWQRKNTDLINSDGLSDIVRSIYSKLDIYILRLALLLHLIYWATDGGRLTLLLPDSMLGAIELVEYFRFMALKANSFIRSETQPDIRDTVVELHRQGLSYRQIAKKVGISKSTVGNILQNK